MNYSRTYQDFTNSGIQQFEQTDIYQKATRIGDRRVKEDNRPHVPDYQRTVVRNVEVPYNRTVRVPTVETKLVQENTTMKVPVKKLVEVPTYRIVDEEYTEWEEVERVRDKEIWVKKIVQEKYIEKVPVKKIRQVRVPHKELQEVEELQDVMVQTNKAVRVPGFRVDEVQDSKLVEVEELENMRFHPEPTGEHQITKTEEGPTIPGEHSTRKEGGEFYEYGDPHVAHLETDNVRSNDYAKDKAYRSAQSFPNHGTVDLSNHPAHRNNQGNRYYGNNTNPDNYPPARTASQPMKPLQDPVTTNGSYGWNSSYNAANGWVSDKTVRQDARFQDRSAGNVAHIDKGQAYHTYSQNQGTNRNKGLGLSCKTTATAHTNSYGVVITRVQNSSVAAFAGLREKDVITNCQGQEIRSVNDLGKAIKTANGGSLMVVYNRDGKSNQIVVNRD